MAAWDDGDNDVMTNTNFEEADPAALTAAKLLANHWRNGLHLDELPAACRPGTPEQGRAVQAAGSSSRCRPSRQWLANSFAAVNAAGSAFSKFVFVIRSLSPSSRAAMPVLLHARTLLRRARLAG